MPHYRVPLCLKSAHCHLESMATLLSEEPQSFAPRHTLAIAPIISTWLDAELQKRICIFISLALFFLDVPDAFMSFVTYSRHLMSREAGASHHDNTDRHERVAG
ncbi:hypothetical protein VTO73DRAFT_14136 [Trametes versicolor]